MNTVADRIATIPDMLAATVAARADQPALGAIVGGQLGWHSWGELGEAARRRAVGLQDLGVAPGDRVAQFSGNSAAWIFADLACQLASAVHVPLHGTLSPHQAAEQTAHAEAKLLLVADEPRKQELEKLVALPVRILTHAELADVGDRLAADGRQLAAVPPPCPDDLATILYTSGTTGEPLGVMLTQRNLASNAAAMCEHLSASPDEIRLGVLPLSHIYARTCDLYIWIIRGSRLVVGESRETLLRDCQIVRPTVLNCVPYVYQKIADGLRRTVGDSLRESQPADAEERVSEKLAYDSAALRNLLGGQVTRCYCGGAALAADVERFFADRGLPVMCGYGLSEASPVITMTAPERIEATTVGRPLANLEVRLADDGEVQVRGPSVMPGYWRNPEATARVLADGWLSTGDLGEWTPGGHLRIVGRKKELLVLATGKKATPTSIEQRLCSSPLIEQACVVGDGRKFLAALIVPAPMGATGVSPVSPRADSLLQEDTGDTPVAHGSEFLRERVREEIDRTLVDMAECEQIGAFTLLEHPFSIERGEMTPKFSLRRKVIEEHYASEIDAMYGAARSNG